MKAEKMYDMLPCVGEMFEKLDIQKIFKDAQNEKDLNKRGMDMIKIILKNSKKVKQEFFELISIYKEITIEEAKNLQPDEAIESLKEIFSELGVMDFFKQAV